MLGGLWVDCRALNCPVRIYQDVKNTDMKYKNRVRSRISNLKDSKNPELKKNVLCGAITPEQIAVMTSEVRKLEEQVCCLQGDALLLLSAQGMSSNGVCNVGSSRGLLIITGA